MNAVVSQGSGYYKDIAGPGDRYQHQSRDVGGHLKEHKQPWDCVTSPRDMVDGDLDNVDLRRRRVDHQSSSSHGLERATGVEVDANQLVTRRDCESTDARVRQLGGRNDDVIAKMQTYDWYEDELTSVNRGISDNPGGRSLRRNNADFEAAALHAESRRSCSSRVYRQSFQTSVDAASNSSHLDSTSSNDDVTTAVTSFDRCQRVSSVTAERLPASRVPGGLEQIDALFQRYDLLNAAKPTSKSVVSHQMSHLTSPFSDRVNKSSPVRRHQDEQSPDTVDHDVTSEKKSSDVNNGSPNRDSENQRADDINTELQTANRAYSLMYKKPKKCKYCDFTSASKETLWAHLHIHVPADKLLYCSLCPFVTELKHHWDTHCRNHDKRKPFKCSLCDYSAVNQSMINSHLKTHSSVRPYVCRYPMCDFKCKFSTQLRSHCEKKHGELTLHGRKSAMRRCRSNSVRDMRLKETASVTGDSSSNVASPTDVSDSTMANWSLSAATSPLWNPQFTAATGRFAADLTYRGQHHISAKADSPLRGLSSSFDFTSPFCKSSLVSSPTHPQFSPITAKIGAIQFNSPVAMRALDLLQQPKTVEVGRTWEPVSGVAMRDGDLRSVVNHESSISRVSDGQSFAQTRSNSYFVLPPSALPLNTPELTATTDMQVRKSIAGHVAGRPTAPVTSTSGRSGIVDTASPLDLTKKYTTKIEPGDDKVLYDDVLCEHASTTSANNCRKPSRRKGVAHKLDVVSANRYTGEDDGADVIVPASSQSTSVAVDLSLRAAGQDSSIKESARTKDENRIKRSADSGILPGDIRCPSGIECQFCDCVFHYSVMHAIHMEFHGQLDDPWRCNKCGFKCNDRLEFNDHIATVAHH